MNDYTLHLGDCLEWMRTLESASVDLIATDPPYFRVKDLEWDKQWRDAAAFLDWMGELCAEWKRILKPNGSLYVFASPEMAARVECKIGESFNVLNSIRWVKDAGWHQKTELEALRGYLSPWESIVFAEQFNSDNNAVNGAGYEAKCDELRGFVFESIRAYLDGERQRAGVSVRQVAEEFQKKSGSRTVTGMAGHWFGTVQWALPTEENYQWLRKTLSGLNHGGDYLRREYEDLRREYEDLRREYEDLRRPFNVSATVPYTDVWDFPTVSTRPGKHPCEKPFAMMSHIIKASSRPGALVLDCFMGSGVTGEAALLAGRRFIGSEKDEQWFSSARRRIERAAIARDVRHIRPIAAGVPVEARGLFAESEAG